MNRVSGNSIGRRLRPLPAAQAPALSCCPIAIFGGMSAATLQSAGAMYAVALEAARRQVARDEALAVAARTN